MTHANAENRIRLSRAAGAVVLLAAILNAGAGAAQSGKEPSVPYTVTIEGLADEDLRDRVRDALSLVEQKDKPPATYIGLRQRADADRRTVRQFLRSEGYYAARVRIRLPRGKTPVPVRVIVQRGPAYKLTAFNMTWADGPHPALSPQDLGIKLGVRSQAQNILSAQQRLFRRLAREGYPFARIRRRRVVVNHRTRTVRVTLAVDQRRRARYGATVIKGAPNVDRGLIRRRIAWRQGRQYDSRTVAQTRSRLNGLGVFASVSIAPDESRLGPDGRAPMVITLTERKPRSIGATAFFDTSEGPGLEVEWLHRNLFGGAERLSIAGGGTRVSHGVKVDFVKPDVFQGPQDLLINGRFQRVDTPAYAGEEAVAYVAIRWRVTDRLTLTLGPTADWASLTQDGVERDFTLGGAIFTLYYDASDDLLNPTRGYRVNLTIAPYVGDGLMFSRIIARGTYYVPVRRNPDWVLAFWTRWGMVVGEANADLPANKRLFSGGGGSVRGFGLQRIGPLDVANNPTGGRSLVEGGVELRVRLAKDWGAVAFIEAGNVFTSTVPDFSTPFRVGAGVGVRYYSPIGLLRLDVATPINRRTGDSLIQIYISLGQAF